MSDQPVAGFAVRLFRSCLLVLGAMLALSWAVDILRVLLPWIVGIAVVVGGLWLAWRWWRGRHQAW
jgi:hypothetical protein